MKKNCKCKTCKCVKKGIQDIKKEKVSAIKSIEEWEKEENEWEKKHPILHKLKQSYYATRRFLIRIIDFFKYDIKHFFQRGRKGWSDKDWWSLPYYISSILVDCLKKLKNEGHGVPTWTDGKTEGEAVKEWKKILNNIIYTFEMAKKIDNLDIDYIATTNKDAEKKRIQCRKINKNIKKKYPNFPLTRVLTEKESKKFEKGFDLFKKWFLHLWD